MNLQVYGWAGNHTQVRSAESRAVRSRQVTNSPVTGNRRRPNDSDPDPACRISSNASLRNIVFWFI